ncbi:MAG: RagB/SusD family nutrient uptake outer membrane protein [Bacteroidales bacterium]|jgi:hypothetical protein|nr:RagB/SusD family nutrient uptake outer membrane protein [Bacteroidales bacterium]MDD4500231.1 RagB/SusD family nutrient uptake outer membrane protein [Bacteroidales bacterium]
MKKKKYLILPAISALFMAVSCVGDLNTLPLNETDYTSEVAYGTEEANYLSGLAKLYLCFTNSDASNLAVDDGGASELIRAFWNLQECSTDEAKSSWESDSWVKDINQLTWSSADNTATYAVYVRTLQGITYINEFLRQTTDSKLGDRGCSGELINKVHEMRAEARFIRAYLYWMSMDVFGNIPFVTEDSEFGAVNPEQKDREYVFHFIVDELKALAESDDMPDARSNQPRADKGSVLGLLARLYLNAEVYTGTVMWSEAKEICEDIFQMGYGLCSNYADLFRGDNGENSEALQEMLFSIYYDHESSTSWGGTMFLTVAAIQSSDEPKSAYLLGSTQHWAGIRVPYEFALKYFNVSSPNYTNGTYSVADDRGKLFFIKGRTQEMTDMTDFTHGWSLFKYSNIPHDMTATSFYSNASYFVDTDMPMIRLAEIYLIYAEACLNLGSVSTALPYINALRTRSNASPVGTADITSDWLLAERGRELLWECHRRTDLIRFDKFTSSNYLWKWKGGTYDGQGVSDHLKIFALPSSELASNSNLTQNPGY